MHGDNTGTATVDCELRQFSGQVSDFQILHPPSMFGFANKLTVVDHSLNRQVNLVQPNLITTAHCG